MAPSIVDDQLPFLNFTDEMYNALAVKILARWADILEIAAQVPSAQEIGRRQQEVGGPTGVSKLGLTVAGQAEAKYTDTICGSDSPSASWRASGLGLDLSAKTPRHLSSPQPEYKAEQT